MKRLKIVGLCLVAVFALTAVVASSASAAAPEYFTCHKAKTKGKGNYGEKLCKTVTTATVNVEESGTGSYERGPWNANPTKVTFKGKGKSPKNNSLNPFGVKMEAGEPAQIEGTTECKTEKLSGKLTGPKTNEWQTEYASCEAGGFKCLSKGLKSGKIKTNVLNSELVFLNSAKTEPGIRVTGTGKIGGPVSKDGELAQYACGPKEAPEAVNIEVFGEVLAKVSGNTEEAQKKTNDHVAEGPLRLQGIGPSYVEEALSEEDAKIFWEYEEAIKACEAGEPPVPRHVTTARNVKLPSPAASAARRTTRSRSARSCLRAS